MASHLLHTVRPVSVPYPLVGLFFRLLYSPTPHLCQPVPATIIPYDAVLCGSRVHPFNPATRAIPVAVFSASCLRAFTQFHSAPLSGISRAVTLFNYRDVSCTMTIRSVFTWSYSLPSLAVFFQLFHLRRLPLLQIANYSCYSLAHIITILSHIHAIIQCVSVCGCQQVSAGWSDSRPIEGGIP